MALKEKALFLLLVMGPVSATSEVPHGEPDDVFQEDDNEELGSEGPYYYEQPLIDLEKLLDDDPEIENEFGELSEEERDKLVASIEKFNQALQDAFKAAAKEEQDANFTLK